MLLNMWTVFEWLKEHNISCAADIPNGSSCIRYIRLEKPDQPERPEGQETVVLRENKEPMNRNVVRSTVSCGIDRILIQNADVITAYNCISECCDYYRQWGQKLLSALLEHKSLQEILMIGHEMFKRPMFIKSAGSLIYAITEEYDDNVHVNWKRFVEISKSHSADLDSVIGVSANSDFQVAFLKTYPSLIYSPVYNSTVLHTNIWVNQKRVAEIIVLENNQKFSSGDPHIMHTFQQIITRYMVDNSEIYLSSSNDMHFFIDLIEGKPYIYSNFNHISQQLRWHENDELAVACVIDYSKCVTPMLNVLNEQLSEIFNNSCFFIYSNLICGIINITKNSGYAETVSALEKQIKSKPFVCGLSYEFTSIDETLPHYRQCVDILQSASRGGGSVMTAYQTAIPFIRKQTKLIPNIACYSHPDLERLCAFDKEHNSDYLNTLFNFLIFGCNYTDTANNMNVHRNTLIYRLTRIREMIHCNLDNPEARKNLLLSYLLVDNELIHAT